jgi:membrane-bound serine protease (ClpP class)
VVNRDGRPPQRQLAENQVQVSFDEPSLLAQTLHAVATPSVTYLLLVLGLLLLVFEFFTAGIGVAAAVGAVCVVLAGYGLGVLPVRGWALALIGIGVVGYSIDVQAGAPRVWTGIGTVTLVVGSALLYDDMSVPLPILAAVIAGVALAMVAGMPPMLRTRFATPTIGRESMIGEEGTALAGIDPEGVVQVRSAPWRARTNRATPIAPGDPVRVIGIDGLLLEVEPLEGAARDAGH